MPHIVPVYNIAKPYTAAAILLTFTPQQRIGEQLKWLPGPLVALSFEDLLSHRSGLNDYFVWPDYREAAKNSEQPWNVKDIIARAEVQTPGSFRYSNIGYLLLRLALEGFYHQPFYDVLDTLIFNPLSIQAWPFATPENRDHCNHPAITEELRTYYPGWVYTGTLATTPKKLPAALR